MKKHAETRFSATLENARSRKSTPLSSADLALILSQQSKMQKMLMKITAFILFEKNGFTG
jgi:hypothetical protein